MSGVAGGVPPQQPWWCTCWARAAGLQGTACLQHALSPLAGSPGPPCPCLLDVVVVVHHILQVEHPLVTGAVVEAALQLAQRHNVAAAGGRKWGKQAVGKHSLARRARAAQASPGPLQQDATWRVQLPGEQTHGAATWSSRPAPPPPQHSQQVVQRVGPHPGAGAGIAARLVVLAERALQAGTGWVAVCVRQACFRTLDQQHPS